MKALGEFVAPAGVCHDGHDMSAPAAEHSDADRRDGGKPREACGVFGVYAPGQPVAHLTYLGLFALQHRGQESAGIATTDGTDITVVKDMGLVSAVFDDRTLDALDGNLAIGHTRYSTTGSSKWHNAQPVFRDMGHTQFALGHNGNLTNTAALATEAGMPDSGTPTTRSASAGACSASCSPMRTRAWWTLRP